MKSSREIKTDKVTGFKDQVSESKATVLAVYKGLTVADMEELRGKLRDAGGQVLIIKNTLAKVALNELGIEALDDDLTGQIAFVFSKKDAVLGTKAAYEFMKDNDNFVVVSGFFDGRRISLDELKTLAMLPSREELQSGLVGILIAPMTDLGGTLQATLRDFIGTLEARGGKLEDGDDSQAAA